MDILWDVISKFISQLQSPTLAFLIAGAMIAAVNSKLRIPTPIYDFAVFMLLMKIGLNAGLVIRETNFLDMIVPIFFCIILGIVIILFGACTLARLPGVKKDDAFATLGLFGAVSGSALVAAMIFLQDEGIPFEAWVPALYPFMDIPALITAIIMANLYKDKGKKDAKKQANIKQIIQECLTSSALTALIAGILLGILTNPQTVLDTFYAPLFKGFLSVIMLVLGMEAYLRFRELAKVAHWYTLFAVVGPIMHGLMGFGLGYIAYLTVGLSPGGVILLGVIAASSSDVSGPPTIRAAIPSANPSAYIGSSTGIGTVVSIGICIPLLTALGKVVFGL